MTDQLTTELLARASHELRTPIAAILGWVQRLRLDVHCEAQRERALAIIERNARLQVTLIEELLDISRAATGKLHVDAQPVCVRDVMQAALDAAQPALESKPLHVHASLAVRCEVMGDARRLQQVASNLLANAIKFTPAHGVVAVSVGERHGWTELVVADTGVGIPRELLPRVFEPFTQAAAAATPAHGGLGLGLAIARTIVELHGGAISAESAGDQRGATFRVRLPPREPDQLPLADSAPARGLPTA